MTDEVTRLEARIAQLDTLLAHLDHCHRIMGSLFEVAIIDNDDEPSTMPPPTVADEIPKALPLALASQPNHQRTQGEPE
jgi:hypothetical protein